MQAIIRPTFPLYFRVSRPHVTTTTTRANELSIVVCSAHSDALISISLQQQAVPKPGLYCYRQRCRLHSASRLHVLILGIQPRITITHTHTLSLSLSDLRPLVISNSPMDFPSSLYCLPLPDGLHRARDMAYVQESRPMPLQVLHAWTGSARHQCVVPPLSLRRRQNLLGALTLPESWQSPQALETSWRIIAAPATLRPAEIQCHVVLYSTGPETGAKVF